MKTIAQTISPETEEEIAAKAARQRRAEREAEIERSILFSLPHYLPMPTISNESDTAFFDQPGAWVSWRRDNRDDWTSLWVLEALEENDFKPVPACLVRWDNYRRTVEPGRMEAIPEVKHPGRNQYKLTDSAQVMPLWLEANRFTGSEIHTFYRSPEGMLLKIGLPGPSSVRVQARRIESLGDWRYDKRTAQIVYPQEWHSVENADGTVIANINENTGAVCFTEQGLDGRVLFTPLVEVDEQPTPAEFYRFLNIS